PHTKKGTNALEQVEKDRVVDASGKFRVEPKVGLHERGQIVGVRTHLFDVSAQTLERIISDARSGQPCGVDLQRSTDLDELQSARLAEHKTPTQGLRQELAGGPAKVRTRTGAHVDDAENFESGQGLTDSGPADSE